ncbi:hypothetical protein [Litorihabitans aurantiacus]|uniref:Uncharacterized protein n=1 Tax=Litorihabitans aurantiacus TaxID=1930061 RepID=A0AA37UN63_9MICO|nr:hypothetical protein [Litorihabitans aurantiacus]GMA30188.1 hypothetical protein GCM10025875_01800 [Litorihabitans aurantiacus]
MGRRPDDEFSDPSAVDDDVAAAGMHRWRGGPLDHGDEDATAGDDAWDDSDTGAGDAADSVEPRPHRRRRPVLTTLTAVAVLAVVTAGVLLAQERERRTPEASVERYAQLVADGEYEAASAIVPVLGSWEGPAVSSAPREVVPELVSDEASANGDFTLVEVTREDETIPPVGETVEVTVRSETDGRPTSSVLRVERRPDSSPGLPSWRVLDSLAVPLVVRVPNKGLVEVTVDSVPVTGTAPEDGDAATMVYPGVHTVAFDGGEYLLAQDVERRVAPAGSSVDPQTWSVIASLDVIPGEAAVGAALADATSFVDACIAGEPADPPCPDPVAAGTAWADLPRYDTTWTQIGSSVFTDGSAPVVVLQLLGSITSPGVTGPPPAVVQLGATVRLGNEPPTVEITPIED